MPSPEVIDLTLSDNEIQPDPIRSDQGPTPTQATNRFRTSSAIPQEICQDFQKTHQSCQAIQDLPGQSISSISTWFPSLKGLQ